MGKRDRKQVEGFINKKDLLEEHNPIEIKKNYLKALRKELRDEVKENFLSKHETNYSAIETLKNVALQKISNIKEIQLNTKEMQNNLSNIPEKASKETLRLKDSILIKCKDFEG